jgi:TRAP-type C4-dicarboxylate transport system substrate-binding protein
MRTLKLIAAALLAAATSAVSAQELTLRAASFVPANTTFGEMCGRFIEHVNAQGKGVIQVRFVGGPDAIPSFEQGNALRTGVLDVACLPPAFYVSQMPEADVAILTRQSNKQLRQSGAWDALNKAHNARMNAWLLASYGEGVAFHVFTNKPVKNVNDLKQLKLRTTPNYTPFFKTIGATLVSTPPGEVRTALERGVVDGYGWPFIGIFDLGWADHTKYRIEPGFYNVVVNVLINQKRWEGLTDAQRNVLTQAGAWLEAENAKWAADKVATDRKRQNDAKIEAIDLGPDFARQAYDAYWTELSARVPDATKALRPMFDK